MRTYKLNQATIDKIKRSLTFYESRGKEFFANLAVKIGQWTMLTFREVGARAGHPAWRKLSESTMRTQAGTWKIRYGTDMGPSRTKLKRVFGQRGPIRDVDRRYGPNSQNTILRASGTFMRSFKTLRVTNRSMAYGTRFQGAEDIIGDRPVLFIMPKDFKEIRTQFREFMLRGIKFQG